MADAGWGTDGGDSKWGGGDKNNNADDAGGEGEDGEKKFKGPRYVIRPPVLRFFFFTCLYFAHRLYETKIVEKEDGTTMESYVPKEMDDDKLFESGISSGINFDKFDKIKVRDSPRQSSGRDRE